MPNTVISVENLTKRYDLGVISTGTLSRDLNRWWAHLRNQPDPYTRIGKEDPFKRRGESILALDDVSFTVQQGEAMGIIGRNGAGKSTLLKILSRVTAPTSGVVKVRGRIGSLLEVGTGFHPELTGRENVFLNGAILGMRKDEVGKKFDEIVDFSGVEKFIDTPVKRYSSGMYVRLAFAVAAHLDPEILVVDEVLAVGDAEFQKKCLGKMSDVAGEGRTVLFVSHNMAAIRQLCSSSILLENGIIMLKGDVSRVVSKYSFAITSNNNLGDIEGRKNISISDFAFYSHDTLVESIASGEDLEIRINLINNFKDKKSLNIGIMLESFMGIFVMRSYSNYENANFYNKTGVYCAKIRKIPFVPGQYKFHLRITAEEKEVYLNPNIRSITIYPGNFFGTGAQGEKRHCLWLQRMEWNYRKY